MDINRVLGALLGGAATPPRRRRRTSAASLLGGRSTEARIGRLLAGVAGAAIGAMMKGGTAPAPAPRPTREPWRETPAPTRDNPWRRPEVTAPPVETGPAAEDAEDLLMIRAMIAAAHADGALDAAERRAIAAQLDAAGLDAAERDFVLADFDSPMRIEALAQAANDPMLKARLYAAGVAGAGQITPAERAWLDDLAKALKLDRAAAAAIEARLVV
jgi:uncharacterized membrane protein YebE (DUF533 family)